jgi:ribonuclease P protein subunit POP4
MSGTNSPVSRNTVNHPAHSLLSRAHSPTTAESIFTSKIKQKPLLLLPTAPDSSSKRSLRRHIRLRKKSYYLAHQRPRPLSAKEKRRLGVHDLKPEEIKYEIYAGLHRIWVGYMWEVLGVTVDGAVKWDGQRSITAQSHGSLLASADFHGAEIEVVRCWCGGRVGTRGIVVRDTKFTFVVVTEKNEVRTLPKRGSMFRYEVPLPDEKGEVPDEKEKGRRLVFEMQGNQFETRPADRASKKFKWNAKDFL